MKTVALLIRNGKLFLKKLIVCVLLCVIFAAGCLLAAKILSQSNAKNYSPMRVAVVNNDTGSTAKLAVNLLSNSKHSFKEVVSLEQMDEADAFSLLENGELAGVIVFPEGSIDGYLVGEDVPITLTVSSASPYEAMLLEQIGDIGGTVLTSGRSGTYTVQRILIEQNETEKFNSLSNKINMSLINKGLSAYSDMTEWETLNLSGALLPLSAHHLLCFFVFFLLCSGGFHADFFLTDYNPSTLKRLASCKVPAVLIAAVKTLYVTVFNIVLINVFLIAAKKYLKIKSDADFISVLAAALFVALLSEALFYLFGKRGATFILAAVSICGLISGGGIVPSMLLPDGMSAVSDFFPNRLLYVSLSTVFKADTSRGGTIIVLGISAVLFLLCTFLIKRKSLGEEASNL